MVMLVLVTVLSLYEMLWLLTAEDHPELHAKYDLVDEADHRMGTEVPHHVADHVVVADLDGDGRSDYALVLVPKRDVGYAVLALLTRGRSHRALFIIERADGHAAAVTLRAQAKAGTRRNALVVTHEGGTSREFVWQGRDFRAASHE
jgi:hypothetical protein